MATYTDTLGYARGNATYPGAAGTSQVSLLRTELDFAKIVAARSAASATALAAGDTMQVMPIPANSVVLHAGIRIKTAETTNTTATFDLGFLGGSPAAANVFCDDAPSNAVAVKQGTGLANPVVIGSSDDTIDLLLNTAVPANAVIVVFALVFNPNQ